MIRRQDWATLTAAAATVAAVVAGLIGVTRWALALAMVGAVAVVVARRSSRSAPRPMPAAMLWLVSWIPHGRGVVSRLLNPQAGERILEIGPGSGQHAMAVARWVGPTGTLEAVDIQQEMLDVVMRRASKEGATNVVRRLADAQRLPHADATFDGAYLSAVLGEIPSPERALRELHRVLKPGGRLVVAEICLDPDFVSFGSLRLDAEIAGFVFEQRRGFSGAYAARFRRP
jgi:SAM-dependent methyltransferase